MTYRNEDYALKQIQGRICYEHGGVPATSCRNATHGWPDPYKPVSEQDKREDEEAWCEPDGCPAVICGGPHIRANLHDRETGEMLGECLLRPDQLVDPKTQAMFKGQYLAMIRREGDGFCTGGQGDPLVREPKR